MIDGLHVACPINRGFTFRTGDTTYCTLDTGTYYICIQFILQLQEIQYETEQNSIIKAAFDINFVL